MGARSCKAYVDTRVLWGLELSESSLEGLGDVMNDGGGGDKWMLVSLPDGVAVVKGFSTTTLCPKP